MSISLNIDLKLNTIHELEVITPLVFLFLKIKSCLILIKNMKGVKMSKKQYKCPVNEDYSELATEILESLEVK